MSMYKLSKDSFKSIKMKLLLQLFLYQLIPCVVISTLFSTMSSMKLVTPFLLLFFGVGMVKQLVHIKRREMEWISFSIELLDDSIKRNQLLILFEDIIRIIEIPNFGLSIQTNDSAKYLFIPFQLEGYNEVKHRLINIKPIEVSPVKANDPIVTTLQSKKPKEGFWKILMKELVAKLAPYLLVLVILFMLVLWLGDFS